MLDRHCHLLYGIDDGAPDRDASLTMLRTAKLAGVTGIVATPHVTNASFNAALARERASELRAYADSMGIALELGYEVHWRVFSRLPFQEAAIYCRENTREILVEFNMSGSLPDNMMKGVYALQREGLHVIIAHPERYECVRRDRGVADEWLEMGCHLQLDANVLTSFPLDPARLCALKLLERGMYRYFASDAHSASDYVRFKRAAAWIASRFEGLRGGEKVGAEEEAGL